MQVALLDDERQQRDIDYLLSLGELFTLVAYGQLLIEKARIDGVSDDLMDQIFDFMVRDFSSFALEMHNKPSSTPEQMHFCAKMLMKPAVDQERYQRVWKDHVHTLNGLYEMND